MRRPELTPARGKSPHADQPDATRQQLIARLIVVATSDMLL
jgi:hypothetical protein